MRGVQVDVYTPDLEQGVMTYTRSIQRQEGGKRLCTLMSMYRRAGKTKVTRPSADSRISRYKTLGQPLNKRHGKLRVSQDKKATKPL